jgi:hypothetical protein
MREVEQLRRLNARLLTEVRELKLSSQFPGRLICSSTTQTTAKLQWGSVSWAQAYTLQYAVGEEGQVRSFTPDFSQDKQRDWLMTVTCVSERSKGKMYPTAKNGPNSDDWLNGNTFPQFFNQAPRSKRNTVAQEPRSDDAYKKAYSGSETQYTLTNLSSQHGYWFRIRAEGDGVHTKWSAPAVFVSTSEKHASITHVSMSSQHSVVSHHFSPFNTWLCGLGASGISVAQHLLFIAMIRPHIPVVLHICLSFHLYTNTHSSAFTILAHWLHTAQAFCGNSQQKPKF